MIFAVMFEDVVARGAEIRQRFLADHLAFLERHASMILSAGPLRDAAGEMAGGLWAVEADNMRNVEELIEADPFFSAGLRRSHRILLWQQVFHQGRLLIPRS